ncbi:MAG: GNAT family N-acetyltransferase [Nostocaceae cyanobacterium]|nr:GNAT family N-acetyltransferase [Nostocaceae cyanobacterium]
MNVIETKRLILREQTLEDTESLHIILSHPITMSFWQFPFTLEATQRWIQRNFESYSNLGFGRYGVILKSTQELIGDCGLIRREIDGVIENDLGYIIHYKHWGQGYATECAAACKQYAIETLKLKRVVVNMPTNHITSIRVAKKIGMVWEKTFNNPQNRDIPTHLYAFNINLTT